MILINLLLCSISTFNSATLLLECNQFRENNIIKLKSSEKPEILDFNNIMQEALQWETGVDSYYTGMIIDKCEKFEFVDEYGIVKQPKITNMTVSPIGKPNIIYEDKTFNFIGHSILKNQTDIEETGSTPIYEKDISSVVSASVTTGLSVSAGCKFEVFDASFETNISSTSTISQTITKKFTIPAQNITIPPHKQVEVNEYWSQVKTTQNISLEMDVSGWARGIYQVHFPDGRKKSWIEMLPLGQAIYAYQKFYWPRCPSQLSINRQSPDIVHFSGIIECWNAGAGSSFNLDISPPKPISD